MINLVKQVIKTEKAPKALGPYSQAILSGNLVFVSGQLGINPQTGELVGGNISDQTKQALTNISSILQAAGSSLSKAVKTTVFLKSINDFKDMNAVYDTFFEQPAPSRSTVAVVELPKNALCEIDCIAIK